MKLLEIIKKNVFELKIEIGNLPHSKKKLTSSR